jgi:hypothetical protein
MLTKGKTTEIDGSRPRLERQDLPARYDVAITDAARDNLTGHEGDSLSPPRYNGLHRGGDSAWRCRSRRRMTVPDFRCKPGKPSLAARTARRSPPTLAVVDTAGARRL